MVGAAALLFHLIPAVVAVVTLVGGRRTPQVVVVPPAVAPPVQQPAAPAAAPVPDAPRKPMPEHPPPPVQPPPVPDAPPVQPPPLNAPPPDLKPDPQPPAPKPAELPPEMQDNVNQAIDRGVAFLRKTQGGDGSWSFSVGLVAGLDSDKVGPTSLAGLTLLECGVPAADPAVANAAAVVRGKARAVQSSFETYEIALAVLFLDRLGDPKDDLLIRAMALRLTAGQTAWGGWTYHCPILSPEDEARLLLALQKTRPTSRSDLVALGNDADAPGADRRTGGAAIRPRIAAVRRVRDLRPGSGRRRRQLQHAVCHPGDVDGPAARCADGARAGPGRPALPGQPA